MSHGKPPLLSLTVRPALPRVPIWIMLLALFGCLAALPAAAEEPWGSQSWQKRSSSQSGTLGIYRVQPKERGVTVFPDQAGDGYRRHYESGQRDDAYGRHDQGYEPWRRDHASRPPSYDRFHDQGDMSRGPEFSRRSWYTQRGDGGHWRNSSRSARQGWYGDLGWHDNSFRGDDDARHGEERSGWGR